MKIYIISDTHFGHDKMLELCGRPKGFEQLILSNLKDLRGDVLIHLGDFCIGGDAAWHYTFLLETDLFERRILVRGNHDHKSDSWYLNMGWDFVCDEFSAKYFGKRILFTHKPSHISFDYDLNIHGHLHNTRHHEEGKCGNHLLFSLEEQNYKAINLEKFISPTNKNTPLQPKLKGV
ncbi:metallophosphoesterase [Candidatus Woesebacteria bacterium]|nr:metallophosphoesterase [Candidatus Woesebacteria bacterium]